jgi:hypothetical protein
MIITNTVGIKQREFNVALDRYLSERTIEEEVYMHMSLFQKSVIQEIKKSLKRIEKKI